METHHDRAGSLGQLAFRHACLTLIAAVAAGYLLAGFASQQANAAWRLASDAAWQTARAFLAGGAGLVGIEGRAYLARDILGQVSEWIRIRETLFVFAAGALGLACSMFIETVLDRAPSRLKRMGYAVQMSICLWVVSFLVASVFVRGTDFVLAATAALACTSVVGFWLYHGDANGAPARGTRDVHEDSAWLTKLAVGFDPEPYIKLGKGIFLGLDVERKPTYVDRCLLDKNHMQILGVSGSGKSSLAGLVLAQLALAGEAVICFDPKFDKRLPGMLNRMLSKQGRRLHLIDLRPGAPAQINPFLRASTTEVEEAINAALELGKSGDAKVDFHRGEDRDASAKTAKLYEAGACTLPALLQAAGLDAEVTQRINFWREFRHLGDLPALHAETGLDLAEAIQRGDCLYVVGSTTNDKVFAAQRLLLQRILQIINARQDDNRPVALMLDELKYLLSNPTLRALGTVRDRNCHLMLAHQSLQDLYDCGSLDPQAVLGAVHGNTTIKIIYRVLHQATAEEFSALSGKQRIQLESDSSAQQLGSKSSTSLREAERNLIPDHLFTHLPKPVNDEASVGVVFGLAPVATLISTRWLASGPIPDVETAPAAVVRPPEDFI